VSAKDFPKITDLELRALDRRINLSDGHPRQAPTTAQAKILGNLAAAFVRADALPHALIEKQAQHAFLTALGQATAPLTHGIRSFYSASVAIDLTARVISELGSRVALVSPTFDNIPHLLRSRGLTLSPVTEAFLVHEDLDSLARSVTCVFVTTPNNPTGWVLTPQRLNALARSCASAGTLLVLDSSFRGFDPAAQYDNYAVLEAAGVDYIVIEDTGKLWPTFELKASFLLHSESCAERVRNAANDVLLDISPVILTLVEYLSRDAVDGGLLALHHFIAENRSRLASALAGTAATLMHDRSRISVALVKLPQDLPGQKLWQRLRTSDVHILPGGAFFWASPQEGERYIRVALSRDPPVIVHASDVLAKLLNTEYRSAARATGKLPWPVAQSASS
jgi:aspartate/methionine/tyrosine aminotransferase